MDNLFGDDIPEDIGSLVDAELSPDEEIVEIDEVTPRSNTELYGHSEIEERFLKEFNSGRLPHAIALTGARGIGKATLAYRIAKFLLSRTEVTGDAQAENLYVPPTNPAYKRILSSGHADLLVIEREYDEKKDRYKSEISVDAVRQIHPFLSKTAAEGGWRVVIIDGAEALNRSSQNAILKVLEEAPKNTMIILTTCQPGRFLPTIKSRCRMINMSPLSGDIMNTLIDTHLHDIGNDEKQALIQMSNGSIGSAIEFHNHDGINLYNEIMGIISKLPELDLVEAHKLAEKLAKPNAESMYNMTFNILLKFCETIVRNSARGISEASDLQNAYPRDHFLNAWDNISKIRNQIDWYNLDKKQGIMRSFMAIQDYNYKEIKA